MAVLQLGILESENIWIFCQLQSAGLGAIRPTVCAALAVVPRQKAVELLTFKCFTWCILNRFKLIMVCTYFHLHFFYLYAVTFFFLKMYYLIVQLHFRLLKCKVFRYKGLFGFLLCKKKIKLFDNDGIIYVCIYCVSVVFCA